LNTRCQRRTCLAARRSWSWTTPGCRVRVAGTPPLPVRTRNSSTGQRRKRRRRPEESDATRCRKWAGGANNRPGRAQHLRGGGVGGVNDFGAGAVAVATVAAFGNRHWPPPPPPLQQQPPPRPLHPGPRVWTTDGDRPRATSGARPLWDTRRRGPEL